MLAGTLISTGCPATAVRTDSCRPNPRWRRPTIADAWRSAETAAASSTWTPRILRTSTGRRSLCRSVNGTWTAWDRLVTTRRCAARCRPISVSRPRSTSCTHKSASRITKRPRSRATPSARSSSRTRSASCTWPRRSGKWTTWRDGCWCRWRNAHSWFYFLIFRFS